jgi:hypothetical protein
MLSVAGFGASLGACCTCAYMQVRGEDHQLWLQAAGQAAAYAAMQCNAALLLLKPACLVLSMALTCMLPGGNHMVPRLQADADGSAANFVETEQLVVINGGEQLYSFVQVGGGQS